jgi:hypothetical protein
LQPHSTSTPWPSRPPSSIRGTLLPRGSSVVQNVSPGRERPLISSISDLIFVVSSRGCMLSLFLHRAALGSANHDEMGIQG